MKVTRNSIAGGVNTGFLDRTMREIRARVSREFAPGKYGYFDTLRECEKVTVSDIWGDPKFAVLNQSRTITSQSANGDNYDCFEASMIVRNWLEQRGIKARVKYGLVGGRMLHTFLEIPGYGFYGATPVDRIINKVDLRNVRGLSKEEISEVLKGFPKIVPFGNYLPMRWVTLGDGRPAIVSVGISLDCAYGLSTRSPFMVLRFTVLVLDRTQLKPIYRYELTFERKSLWAVVDMAKKNGARGITGVYKGQAQFDAREFRDPLDPTIPRSINEHEDVLHYLITKIDPSAIEKLKTDPNYFHHVQ